MYIGQAQSGLHAYGEPAGRTRRRWKYVQLFFTCGEIDTRIRNESKFFRRPVPQCSTATTISPHSPKSACRQCTLSFWLPHMSWRAHASSFQKMPGEQTLNTPMRRQSGNIAFKILGFYCMGCKTMYWRTYLQQNPWLVHPIDRPMSFQAACQSTSNHIMCK